MVDRVAGRALGRVTGRAASGAVVGLGGGSFSASWSKELFSATGITIKLLRMAQGKAKIF
jgi:hypothetical protein